MFWQFENGTLLNMNVFKEIRLFQGEKGLWHVMAIHRDDEMDCLFSSKNKERAEQALENIGKSLEEQNSLVRKYYVKLG